MSGRADIRSFVCLTALKKDDIVELKKRWGFNPDESFVVPDEVKEAYSKAADKGAKLESEWN